MPNGGCSKTVVKLFSLGLLLTILPSVLSSKEQKPCLLAPVKGCTCNTVKVKLLKLKKSGKSSFYKGSKIIVLEALPRVILLTILGRQRFGSVHFLFQFGPDSHASTAKLWCINPHTQPRQQPHHSLPQRPILRI